MHPWESCPTILTSALVVVSDPGGSGHEQRPSAPEPRGAAALGRHPTPMCAYTSRMTSRQNTQTLPPPLVVLDALAYCDGPDVHEARIVSDGTRAVAHLTAPVTHADYTDQVTVARVGTMLEGECPGERHGGPCPGSLSWSLATEGAWTAHHESITLLTTYGEQVER